MLSSFDIRQHRRRMLAHHMRSGVTPVIASPHLCMPTLLLQHPAVLLASCAAQAIRR